MTQGTLPAEDGTVSDDAAASVPKPSPTARVPGAKRPNEHGGPAGLDPTRYGDWERKGRCIDF